INTSSLCRIKSESGSTLLARRSELLFGSQGKGRRTHIMVTLDSSDIFQYELIEQLLENGLEIARINCAHNAKREWKLSEVSKFMSLLFITLPRFRNNYSLE
ncbi:MAG: hypothetical protein WA667_11360, partial [Candidatus Nitrosopolaris sp.]